MRTLIADEVNGVPRVTLDIRRLPYHDWLRFTRRSDWHECAFLTKVEILARNPSRDQYDDPERGVK
jgi:hypothetical protein